MAWDSTMILMLRGIIGDLDSETYADDRLKQLLTIGATFVQQALGTSTYTISVDCSEISPDPVLTKDVGFVNLTVLKTACLIGASEWKTNARGSMMVKDDVSSIDTRSKASETKEWAKDICEGYAQAELEYRLGNSKAGHAIVGPHCTDEMLTTQAINDHRGRINGFN